MNPLHPEFNLTDLQKFFNTPHDLTDDIENTSLGNPAHIENNENHKPLEPKHFKNNTIEAKESIREIKQEKNSIFPIQMRICVVFDIQTRKNEEIIKNSRPSEKVYNESLKNQCQTVVSTSSRKSETNVIFGEQRRNSIDDLILECEKCLDDIDKLMEVE